MEPSANPIVLHNPAASRFELEQEGHLVVLEYLLEKGKIVFTHTGVPQELGGRGLGSLLARAGLDLARSEGLKVVPLCSFIAGYIQKHPEYQDLIE
jgi:predicted GNAT family acetyltransferase